MGDRRERLEQEDSSPKCGIVGYCGSLGQHSLYREGRRDLAILDPGGLMGLKRAKEASRCLRVIQS